MEFLELFIFLPEAAVHFLRKQSFPCLNLFVSIHCPLIFKNLSTSWMIIDSIISKELILIDSIISKELNLIDSIIYKALTPKVLTVIDSILKH